MKKISNIFLVLAITLFISINSTAAERPAFEIKGNGLYETRTDNLWYILSPPNVVVDMENNTLTIKSDLGYSPGIKQHDESLLYDGFYIEMEEENPFPPFRIAVLGPNGGKFKLLDCQSASNCQISIRAFVFDGKGVEFRTQPFILNYGKVTPKYIDNLWGLAQNQKTVLHLVKNPDDSDCLADENGFIKHSMGPPNVFFNIVKKTLVIPPHRNFRNGPGNSVEEIAYDGFVVNSEFTPIQGPPKATVKVEFGPNGGEFQLPPTVLETSGKNYKTVFYLKIFGFVTDNKGARHKTEAISFKYLR